MSTERIIATDRAEHEPCERGTEGCCIDHLAESARLLGAYDGGCETW